MKRCLILLVGMLFCALPVDARTYKELRAMPLTDLVEVLDSVCDFSDQCDTPFTIEEMDVRDIANKKLKKLKQKAWDRAQIWADTILEGDYIAFGNTELSQVRVFKFDGKVIAYHIRYYERAAETSSESCVYNEQRGYYEGRCVGGVIRESGYISWNMLDETDDEGEYAEFIPNSALSRFNHPE